MKTKWSFIYILVLVATLLSMSTSPAQAAKPLPAACPNAGDFKITSQSGPNFTFCINNNGVIDTYSVKMIRSYEVDYYSKNVIKGSTVSFKSLNWTMSQLKVTYNYYYEFSLSAAQEAPYTGLSFDYLLVPFPDPINGNPVPSYGNYNLVITDYQWTRSTMETMLYVETQTWKNGVPYPIRTEKIDHFDTGLYRDACVLFGSN